MNLQADKQIDANKLQMKYCQQCAYREALNLHTIWLQKYALAEIPSTCTKNITNNSLTESCQLSGSSTTLTISRRVIPTVQREPVQQSTEKKNDMV